MSIVARYYQVKIDELKIPIRDKSKPRFVAMYLATKITGESLQVIANNFTNITYSGVSRIARNVETKLKHDIKLQKEIDNIKIDCF
jgi:chromosomal replication initiation ATPase DnaA